MLVTVVLMLILNHLHVFLNIAGPDKEIDVIDVCRQCDLKMRLGDFVEYYNSPNRDRVLNVISLEFSETRCTFFTSFIQFLKEHSGHLNELDNNFSVEAELLKT